MTPGRRHTSIHAPCGLERPGRAGPCKRGAAAGPQVRVGGEQLQRAKRAQRAAAVRGAEVVACTLAAAGGDLLGLVEGGPLFDALVIDEARPSRRAAGLL